MYEDEVMIKDIIMDEVEDIYQIMTKYIFYNNLYIL